MTSETFECEECGVEIEEGEEYPSAGGGCLCFECYYDDQHESDPYGFFDY